MENDGCKKNETGINNKTKRKTQKKYLTPFSSLDKAGPYTVTATCGTTSDSITVVAIPEVELISVDAADPHAVKVNYQITPSGTEVPSVAFTAPGASGLKNDVSDTFFFTFDQSDITSSPATIQLVHSYGTVDCTVTVTNENVQNIDTVFAHFGGSIGVIGLNHTGKEYYTKYNYSCPSSGKTIYSNASGALMYFGSSFGSIGWLEQHRFTWTGDGGGSTAWTTMTPTAGLFPPSTSGMGCTNNVWLDPDLNITGTCHISGLVYSLPGGVFVMAYIILNDDADNSMP